MRAHGHGLPTTAEVADGMALTAAQYGFRAVLPHEFVAARRMAGRRMGHEVSTARTFRAVQKLQPLSCVCFCEGGAITGVIGILLLREAAAEQLRSGRFDGVNVDLDLLARAGEHPAIGYGWGMAASTKPAGAAIIAVTQAFRAGPLAEFTFITKAVTAVGRHVSITRFGYRPMRGPDDDLLINDPVVVQPGPRERGLADPGPSSLERSTRALSREEVPGVK